LARTFIAPAFVTTARRCITALRHRVESSTHEVGSRRVPPPRNAALFTNHAPLHGQAFGDGPKGEKFELNRREKKRRVGRLARCRRLGS
jgi:hypothetical protein